MRLLSRAFAAFCIDSGKFKSRADRQKIIRLHHRADNVELAAHAVAQYLEHARKAIEIGPGGDYDTAPPGGNRGGSGRQAAHKFRGNPDVFGRRKIADSAARTFTRDKAFHGGVNCRYYFLGNYFAGGNEKDLVLRKLESKIRQCVLVPRIVPCVDSQVQRSIQY